jgi:23S rRNA (pseudouridine1915-N3)-methyltransferase
VTKQILLSVGKRHDPALAGAIDEFTTRLNREVETEWQFIKPSGADYITARRLESAALLEIIRDNDFVVLCDERGREVISPALARLYDGWLERHQRVVFIIGGAYGVNTSIHERANMILALSLLVFPHQLARLILVEQLYRARMISKNHPYHHT